MDRFSSTVSLFAAVSLYSFVYGAVTITASKDYVDRKTRVNSVTNVEIGVVGYTVGANSNEVFASTNYVNKKMAGTVPGDYGTVSNAAMKAYSDLVEFASTGAVYRISDGTDTIDAAGNVFRQELSPWYAKSLAIGEGTTNYIPYLILEYKTIQVVGEANKEGWLSNVPYQNIDGYGDIYFFLTSDLQSAEYLGKDGNNYSVITGDNITRSTSTNITQIGYEGCYIFRDTVYRNIIVGKLALTNDMPPAIEVVAPTTNAAAGTAADAKATGTALFTGFTEWELSSQAFHLSWTGSGWEPRDIFENAWGVAKGTESSTSLAWSVTSGDADEITATRHLITPTKTSQLQNDGDGTNAFATVEQIPAPVDISGKLDGAAAYPAWNPNKGYEGDGAVVSYAGRLWENYATTEAGDKPTEHPSLFREKTLEELKQDKLTQTQIDYINSVPGMVSSSALAGQTFDLSTNRGLYEGILNCLDQLGAAITNAPSGFSKTNGVWRYMAPAQQGGN